MTAPARVRLAIFVCVCIGAVATGLGAIVLARARHEEQLRSSPDVQVAAAGPDRIGDERTLLFSSTALGTRFGGLASVRASGPGAARRFYALDCERVHYRAGRGICLRADRGFVTRYDAVIFDDTGTALHTLTLAGSPSRTKVAPSGRIGAITVFVTGHSYAQGGFSTQTTLVDLEAGSVIADLETGFTVTRDGERWREIDFNFWGVTFVDDETFFATVGSGGEAFLIRGNISTRSAEVVRAGVECPSLSPDRTRIAFKERNEGGPGPITWHITVLDLATGRTTRLAESRNVDDQIEWLDDHTVTYGLPDDGSTAEIGTWQVAADGTGVPRLLVAGASSLTVIAADTPAPPDLATPNELPSSTTG